MSKIEGHVERSTGTVLVYAFLFEGVGRRTWKVRQWGLRLGAGDRAPGRKRETNRAPFGDQLVRLPRVQLRLVGDFLGSREGRYLMRGAAAQVSKGGIVVV